MTEKTAYKTIKEFADELKISRQTVHYHVSKELSDKRVHNDKGIVVLTPTEQEIIRNKVVKKAVKKTVIKNNLYDKNKDQQIHSLEKQVDKLSTLLDQQQKLQLKTQQLLEEKTKLIESNESKINKQIEFVSGYEKLLNNQNIKYADEKNVMEYKATRLSYLAIGLGVISFIAIILCFVLWLSWHQLAPLGQSSAWHALNEIAGGAFYAGGEHKNKMKKTGDCLFFLPRVWGESPIWLPYGSQANRQGFHRQCTFLRSKV